MTAVFNSVVVSFDGSWHKRGRTSNYGLVAVIEVNTGLVIDYEILSKYCHLCSITAAEMDKDSPEFIEWYERHLELGECNTNFSGASGNMVRKGAVMIDLSKMKNAVLAPIHHCASTDAKPMHQYCPSGPESWCFYQKAKAANRRSKPSHKDMKTVINKQVFDAILPVYKRLSDSELLKRCHSRLELGGTQAVGEFNMGCVAFMATQAEVTERPNNAQSMKNAEKIDRKRVAQSDREASVDGEKKRAKKKRQRKNKGVDRYEPGGGD
ncbi:hypothetical protein KUF71_002033 [Frankliniella fusca]|uniref:Mutator-like transposase domain-containing protein n=1 Tax=Frankliniella fusca TaxID=407009 RepID=A0AAE1HN45_9NEOP|nr:hypothetical protein KUF71_002033 [Frankliniella fusca]